ncbi:MAG: redoxin domain-containing protein [Acidimicrobiia bacterium]
MIEVGQPAPPFTLRNIDKAEMSLDDFKGSKTLLVFIPFPFTGICEGELCLLRDSLADLNDMDANVVVVTTTPLPSNAAWAEKNGFEFPILSDFWPHGEVVKAYGVFNDKVGAANRTTFVLDAEGIVSDVISSPDLGTPREHALYEQALAVIA